MHPTDKGGMVTYPIDNIDGDMSFGNVRHFE